jgi:DNA repair protein RecN (Recombination protein N)
MLTALTIRNLAIIDAVDLTLASGFTVLTGETGAGKSILIDALGLIAGARGDAQQVRDGCDKAEISAEFSLADPTAPAYRWLDDNALLDADDPLHVVIRRVVFAEGRSRAFVNAQAVTAGALRELGDHLIDIYGQAESQTLLRSDVQRDVLDRYGAVDGPLAEVAGLARELASLDAQLREAADAGQADPARLDFLRFQIQELTALGLSADELPTLEAHHRRLANAGRLVDDGSRTLAELYGEDTSAETAVGRAIQQMEALAELDPQLQELVGVLETARTQIDEVAHSLRAALERLDLDPAALQQAEQRLADIHDMARKYRVAASELPAHRQHLEAELDRYAHQGEHLAALQAQRDTLLQRYRTAADALTEARQAAATQLAQGATPIVRGLGMAEAEFDIHVTPDPRYPVRATGVDEVNFAFSANPGQTPRPLAKVASGGELSRVSLALQVVASHRQPLASMVFDEVDAGISGAVAARVGQELRALGTHHQVLCVTHQPQVAAQAQQHLAIHKEVAAGQTFTRVTPLDHDARIDALARLQGGKAVTDAARALAADLLAQAQS